MAEVKFIYISDSAQGPKEADPAVDTTALAGLALSGNLVLTSGAKVTGVPTPISDTDVVNKFYVDSLVAGTPWKRVECLGMISDALSTPPVSPAIGDSYIVGATPTGDWSGFVQGSLVQWNGTSWVGIVDGSGGEPVDTLRVVVTTSVSAAGSFAGHDGDIAEYNAGTNAWSFTAAADGKAVIVAGEGAYYENTQWVYDSSSSEWIMFGGDIGAGNGLYKSAGNIMNVGDGDGIAIGADAIAVDLDPTTPGLEFNGVSPSGRLRVKVDGSHGIIRGATGLEIEIDDTVDTLDVDASGLKVVGVPSLFKVAGTATGATVTANNLSALTNGSNADLLHTHVISAVDEAKRVEQTHTNNVAVTAGRAVRWSSTNNQITHADNSSDPGSRVIGIARTGGSGDPGTSEVVKHGVCPGALSGATANDAYFLGANGVPVLFAAIPKPGRVVRLGFAVNSSDLDVQIIDFGARGA